MSDRVIVICGPTASGKSAFAVQLSQKLHAPIINADSRQVYRELEIGVAKPTAAEQKAAPHHLIDIISIEEPYSAGQWSRDARAILQRYFEDGRGSSGEPKTMLISGGSGLHVKSLVEGIPKMPPVSIETREHYTKLFESAGIEALQRELKELDPHYFAEVDLQNQHRLMRALTVIKDSGQQFSVLRKAQANPLPQQVFWVILEPDREELYERINRRVDRMVAAGLEQEAAGFAERRTLDALQTIGYREWWPYFEGEYDRERAIELIKQATRRYARRQLTWNRKLKGLRLKAPSVEQVLTYLKGNNQ